MFFMIDDIPIVRVDGSLSTIIVRLLFFGCCMGYFVFSKPSYRRESSRFIISNGPIKITAAKYESEMYRLK